MKYNAETEKRGISYVIYSPLDTLMYQYNIKVDNIYLWIIQEVTQACRCRKIDLINLETILCTKLRTSSLFY